METIPESPLIDRHVIPGNNDYPADYTGACGTGNTSEHYVRRSHLRPEELDYMRGYDMGEYDLEDCRPLDCDLGGYSAEEEEEEGHPCCPLDGGKCDCGNEKAEVNSNGYTPMYGPDDPHIPPSVNPDYPPVAYVNPSDLPGVKQTYLSHSPGTHTLPDRSSTYPCLSPGPEHGQPEVVGDDVIAYPGYQGEIYRPRPPPYSPPGHVGSPTPEALGRDNDNDDDLDDVFLPASKSDLLDELEFAALSARPGQNAPPPGADRSRDKPRGGLSTCALVCLLLAVFLLLASSTGLAVVAGFSIYRQLQAEVRIAGSNATYCRYPVTYTVPSYRGMVLDAGAPVPLLPGGSPALVVLTRDVHGPVKVYDCRGKLLHNLGAGIQELAAGDRLDMSVDTARGHYLIPVPGILLALPRVGSGGVSYPLPGDIRGVTYLQHEDLYVVGRGAACQLSIINPRDNRDVIRTLNHSALCDARFLSSYYSTTHKQSVIVVSGEHQVSLFSTDGRPLGELRGLGEGLGVSADPSGLIVSCDQCNTPRCQGSVLTNQAPGEEKGGAVSRRGGAWKNILSLSDSAPWCVDHEPSSRVIAIGADNDQIHLFNYRYK